MKKAALLLSFCALSAAATAQTEGSRVSGIRSSTDYAPGSGSSDSRNNGFGIKGGLNWSQIHGDDKDNYDNLGSYRNFHAGVYAQFGFNDKFSIQPEVLYSRQGFEGSSASRSNTNTYFTRLDYIQVPVLLVYNIVDNVSVHVGPQVSLLTKVREAGQERKIANEDNLYDYSYNSLDYGLSAGLEGRIGPARVGGRYTAGFADVIKDPKNTAAQSLANIKNGAFQVYVGIGISN
ncbi:MULTISPECIES: porin family protein [Hymenobacter]|uniref:Outer membrane protein beta-barrel domain-containing protein n=1 Tax=Hymenobacter mucosus TaxID=1411120 RepID=A0A238X5E7_9BACT|nr:MULTISPECIES: porin family protein [Hymenobacter]SNR53783.1 Outer membrane protein beta-barrel domain-containing protein [Hymenobacter mucosus]